MRVLALLLAASALLAGCVTTPASQVDQAGLVPDASGDLGLSSVVHGIDGALLPVPADIERAIGGAYITGVGAVEPTIGVDKDGTLFMTGILPGVRGAPTIMRSDDKGQTWTAVGATPHVATLDPYVYVDPATGRVFQDDILPLGCGMTSFSDDKGKSWTTNPLGCGTPQVNDHQTLVAAKPRKLTTVGYPNVIYRCVNNVAYSACAVSLNGGLTFLQQVPVTGYLGVDPKHNPQTTPLCSALTGHLEAAPDGRVYLPSIDCTVLRSAPMVAVTEDDGLTWTTHIINKDRVSDGHDVGIAVDEAGNVFANWVSEGRMLLASSTDAGKTWSEPIDVTAPGLTATSFNAIAAGTDGRIALAYIGTDIEGGYEGKTKADDWKGAEWNAFLAVITDALSPTPVVQTVTANDPSDPVARGQCGRTRCNGMTDFIEIVVDVEGRPWASFVDVCNDDCATSADGKNTGNMGFAATLRAGPALRGALAALPLLDPQPTVG